VESVVNDLFDNCRESSTNQPFFLQNKANFKKARMNVNYYLQKDYENERLCRPPGKQSQTKPNKANYAWRLAPRPVLGVIIP
jgi:hypothetical protein